MQVRNFGKRAQTKYTHLAKEDTTNQGESWGVKRSGGGYGEKFGGRDGAMGGNGCFHCGKEGHVSFFSLFAFLTCERQCGLEEEFHY